MEFGRAPKQAGTPHPAGSAGDAYDSAMAESFAPTLRREPVNRSAWPAREAARLAISERIECFYNRSRLHPEIGYLSPAQFEKGGTMTHAAAA